MENELKELLRSKAESLGAEPGIPAPLLRRARRRRTMNATLAGALAVGIAFGGFAGVRAALGPNASDRLGPADPPVATWRGLYPYDNREDAEIAQERVNDGDAELAWTISLFDVLHGFGNEVLGWTDIFVVDETVDIPEGAPGPYELHVSTCSLEGQAPDAGCENATVTVERLLQPNPQGIWFVTEYERLGETDPTPPGPHAEVRSFVEKFMDARVEAERGAEAFLTVEADRLYDGHEGGLYLYDGDVEGGEPETAWASYEVVSIQSPGDSYQVRVRITTGEFEGASTSFDEILEVGPGTDVDGTERTYVIRYALRTIAEPGSEEAARALAEDFMQSRIAGSGAEELLSVGAQQQYEDHQGGLYLYDADVEGGREGVNYTGFEVVTVTGDGPNDFRVQVRLDYVELSNPCSGEGCPETYVVEELVIGPGRQDVTSNPLRVIEAQVV
jgi:hypothetical protein